MIFTGIAALVIILTTVGLMCKPSLESEPWKKYEPYKTVFGDFDGNGIEEYILTFEYATGEFEPHLQFYWNETCIYDYISSGTVLATIADYIDLDEDGEKEVYLQYSSLRNGVIPAEYIVLKQKGEIWEPLEMFHGEFMFDNVFPITIKGGKDYTIEMSCEGIEKTASYPLESYWKGILKEKLRESEAVSLYWKSAAKQDKEEFQAGEEYGQILGDVICGIESGSFEGKNCLIASHAIGTIHSSRDEIGFLDIYFNYDQNGKIRILNIEFVPRVYSEDLAG